MARRGLKGQLNMFDFFHSLEEPGEVEMVSLVPEYEEEPEAEIEPEPENEPETVVEPEPAAYKQDEAVVMSRSYNRDGVSIEIAYLNYNKVRIQHGGAETEIKTFATSKEAVDYYVEVMQEYEIDV